jgi:hypothetical protein
MVEQEAVNFKVRGSNPRRGAKVYHQHILVLSCMDLARPIPVDAIVTITVLSLNFILFLLNGCF